MDQAEPRRKNEKTIDLTPMFADIGGFECHAAYGRIVSGNQVLVSLSSAAGPCDSLILNIDAIYTCLNNLRCAQAQAKEKA